MSTLMKLSIVVITMNRADQLRSALQSCVNCKLPKEVEFVVVDNASTDNTKEVVEDFFSKNPFSYTYEYQPENLGVGGGRNRAFELSKGEFAYFLDDDAVIAEDSYEKFFIKPIEYFELNKDVASITTRIYDELLEFDRDVRVSRRLADKDVPNILMYLGGSHFLRKSYYESPLYLDIKYGMEEILPSIKAIDNGWRNCFMNDITLLHQPKRNKWVPNSEESKNIAIGYNVNMYCAKRMLYPWYMQPIIWLTFWLRNFSQFGCDIKFLKKAQMAYHKQYNPKLTTKKVSFRTIKAITHDYSLSALV